MLVASFERFSSYSGKTLQYEDGRFVITDVGGVSAARVASLDQTSELIWADEHVSQWFREQFYGGSFGPTNATQSSGRTTPAPSQVGKPVEPHMSEPQETSAIIATVVANGAAVSSDSSGFAVTGLGRVTHEHVRALDASGGLMWVSDHARDWFYSPQPSRDFAQVAPSQGPRTIVGMPLRQFVVVLLAVVLCFIVFLFREMPIRGQVASGSSVLVGGETYAVIENKTSDDIRRGDKVELEALDIDHDGTTDAYNITKLLEVSGQ